jgi:hypothetical protein
MLVLAVAVVELVVVVEVVVMVVRRWGCGGVSTRCLEKEGNIVAVEGFRQEHSSTSWAQVETESGLCIHDNFKSPIERKGKP